MKCVDISFANVHGRKRSYRHKKQSIDIRSLPKGSIYTFKIECMWNGASIHLRYQNNTGDWKRKEEKKNVKEYVDDLRLNQWDRRRWTTSVGTEKNIRGKKGMPSLKKCVRSIYDAFENQTLVINHSEKKPNRWRKLIHLNRVNAL